MGNPLLLVLKGLHKTILGREKQDHNEAPKQLETTTEVVSAQKHVQAPEQAQQVQETTLPHESRRLRSEKSHSNNADATLFRFDMKLAAIDYNIPTKLIPAARPLNRTKKMPAVKKTGGIELSQFDYPVPSISRPKVDALDDSGYVPHHRRLERDEKRLHNIEREKNALEMDRLASHYKNLKDEQSWRKAMVQLVALDDPNDEHELVAKRALVLAELDTCFVRYNEWKRKMNEQRALRGAENEHENYVKNEVKIEPEAEKALVQKKKRASLAVRGDTPKKRQKPASASANVPVPRAEGPPTRITSFFEPSDKARYVCFDQLIRRDHRNQLAFGRAIPYLALKEFEMPPTNVS